MIIDAQNPFNTYMNMVTAIAVTGGLIMGYLRDKRLEKSNARVATAVTEVAVKAKEVATQADKAAVAVEGVKTELSSNTTKTTKAICEVKDELTEAHSDIRKVHTIVNSEKTASMEELRSSRLLTLTAFKALSAATPGSTELRQAVAAAQALYDKIDQETVTKIALDDSMR